MKAKREKKKRSASATGAIRRIQHEAEGGAVGLLGGAVVGSVAGLPGALAGAVMGGVAGAMAGAVLDSRKGILRGKRCLTCQP